MLPPVLTSGWHSSLCSGLLLLRVLVEVVLRLDREQWHNMVMNRVIVWAAIT